MNGSALIRIFASLACIIAALFITFDILTAQGNVLARVYMYLMGVSFLVGLLAPRGGFYLMLGMTAYVDYFKRMMIFDSGLTKMDLYFVLGMSPAAVAGIAANLIYRTSTGKLKLAPGMGKFIGVVIFLMLGITGVLLAGSKDKFRAVGDTVNTTMYLNLVYIVPILFPSAADLRILLRRLVVIYVPAVLYMLVHFYRSAGLNMKVPLFSWELKYVLSGYTIEIRQLAERKFRSFGTMNNAANASIVFGTLVALICSGMWKFRSRPPYQRDTIQPGRFFWAVVIAVAAYSTFSRAGWVVGLGACVIAVAFRSRFATLSMYAAGTAIVALVIIFSSYILKNKILNDISADIYQEQRTDTWAQTTNLATFNDRLTGFENWTDPKNWSPFGLYLDKSSKARQRSEIERHDVFTDLLVRVGFVGLTLMLSAGIWILKTLHGFVLRQPPGMVKCMASVCLANVVMICATGFGTTEVFNTYPANVFLSFYLAIVVALIFEERTRIYEEKKAAFEAANAVKDQEEAAAEDNPRPPRRLGPARPGRRTPQHAGV